jgi:hypothetical protein
MRRKSNSEIERMTDEARRRLRIGQKISRKRRPEFTKDGLLEFLRRSGACSARKLMAVAAEGRPNVYDFIKTFGSWKGAKVEAFGVGVERPNDMEYLVKCAIQFDLRTYREYLAARRRNPDVVPSSYFVVKRWGSFSNFFAFVKRKNIGEIMMRYMLLTRKMGRPPSMAETEAEGIILDEPIDFYGSKAEVDKFIVEMEKVHERKK